ncbi:hypothetical protein K438DRAFT_1969513 [Mycena galopus ATCC 62051]|nr:hypothetical protein K438DRAFT_1969513 [Mycena galopus ATCC 62051]
MGFLFLCPESDLQAGPFSFCWPDCAAYWSLDPSGVDRLSQDETTWLGFPRFCFITKDEGCYFDASVYDGLRKFHLAKGFITESQDLARHLGHPLYQLSSKFDDIEDDHCRYVPVAYVELGFHFQLIRFPEVNDTSELFLAASKELPVISETFKFLMNIQFMLISFLALS